MKQFCLIGHPLGHSISPQIHSRLFALSGVEADYRLWDIEPDRFESEMDALRSLDGFNITIPYKQRIFPFLKSIDPAAEAYGAVNTVTCTGGEFHGCNTDADGFLRALSEAGIALSGKVLLCGAGGVAHMMATEVLKNGCSLAVATPALSEARNFIDELQKKYPDADVSASALSYLSGSFDLILNGTPSGMFPDLKSCPVPLPVARSAGAVFDAVYNPIETQLVKIAKAAGAKTQGGLSMLVHQAAAAQEIWTGARFGQEETESIRREMAALLSTRS